MRVAEEKEGRWSYYASAPPPPPPSRVVAQLRNFTISYSFRNGTAPNGSETYVTLRIHGVEPATGEGYPVYVHSGGTGDALRSSPTRHPPCAGPRRPLCTYRLARSIVSPTCDVASPWRRSQATSLTSRSRRYRWRKRWRRAASSPPSSSCHKACTWAAWARTLSSTSRAGSMGMMARVTSRALRWPCCAGAKPPTALRGLRCTASLPRGCSSAWLRASLLV